MKNTLLKTVQKFTATTNTYVKKMSAELYTRAVLVSKLGAAFEGLVVAGSHSVQSNCMTVIMAAEG